MRVSVCVFSKTCNGCSNGDGLDVQESDSESDAVQCSAVQSVLTSSRSTGGGGGGQGFCTVLARRSSSLSVVILPHLSPCHTTVAVAATCPTAS